MPLAHVTARPRYFDFVTYHDLTALSMGTETFEGDLEPPLFRAWADRALSLLRFVKA